MDSQIYWRGYNFLLNKMIRAKIQLSPDGQKSQAPAIKNQHPAGKSNFQSWWEKNSGILVVLAALLVIGVYFWYITAGKWVWTPLTYYFDHLADAFLQGSTSLLEKPPAALAALANPYKFANRVGIEYIWDASYFRGNYYLYWGPVPALTAAAIKYLRQMALDDQQLVFLFMAELTVVMAALLHWLRTTFLPKVPAWSAALLILAGMLSLPALWIINRPSVYEGAIAGGQFFLILGLYSGLRGMFSTRKAGWMVLAGLAWVASIGCRVNNAAAIAWLVVVTLLYLVRQRNRPFDWILPGLCLCLPLLFWGLGLGAYNFARFGTVLEFGHRYQLTARGLPENYNDISSVRYILPNLYNLLVRSFHYNPREFPFIQIPSINESLWPAFIHLPPHYLSDEPAAGIFKVVPIFWVILLPLLIPARSVWNRLRNIPAKTSPPSHPSLPWVWWMAGGAALCILGSLSIFIASNLRYLMDLVPLLTILSALSFWWTLQLLGESRPWKIVLCILLIFLGVASIIYGLLAGFGEYPFRFQTINPQLYTEIARFLGSK
jgi:hypothetical protein